MKKFRDSEFGPYVDHTAVSGQTNWVHCRTKQDVGRVYQRLNRYKNAMIDFEQQEVGKVVSLYQYIVMRKDFENNIIEIIFDDPNSRIVEIADNEGNRIKAPGGIFSQWWYMVMDTENELPAEYYGMDDHNILRKMIEDYYAGTGDPIEVEQKPTVDFDPDDPTLDSDSDLGL
jgi:hypothetical protein